MAKALTRPDILAQLESQGVRARSRHAQRGAPISTATVRWSKFVADHGIKAE